MMKFFPIQALTLFLLFLICFASHWLGDGAVLAQQKDANFNRVEGVFVTHCFECHAGENAESGFRLDATRDVLLAGGDSGDPAVLPGQPNQSQLIKWITEVSASKRMPPDRKALSRQEIEIIRDWISRGAQMEKPFQKHGEKLWSFQPLQKSFRFDPDELVERKKNPKGDSSQRATGLSSLENRIDYFLAQELKKKGLWFNPRETREVLIRRIYLVMLGYPPRPDEVDFFVNDMKPDAYTRLVDRVLSSTAYGEKWAQHWLDIIRFGETHGFETNRERPNAWPFRDYVIESLNSDKPYDEFVREQIAGDQLGNPVATGFIVAGPHDIVKSPDINLTLMQRQDELADIVNVAGTTFLGLTVGCARCHNHKFDPITQKDFYAMQAVFAGVQHADRNLPPDKESSSEISVLKAKVATLEKSLEPFVRAASSAMIAIDDDDTVKTKSGKFLEHLAQPEGFGVNPPGKQRGHRDDTGSINHSPNLSGGRYTWWKNVPGKPVAKYRPGSEGKFRIWLSWGVGHSTHTKDAVYELDLDGDLTTTSDVKRLAKVNQTEFAEFHLTNGIEGGETGAKASGKSLWSGFKNVGIHELNKGSALVLRGGDSGEAITTDIVFFEPIPADSSGNALQRRQPLIRPVVSGTHNIENFPAMKARYIRFSIEKSSASQPCIDELEIYSGATNVALASAGAVASSSGDFVHELHKLAHINDGKYGNSHSWIAKEERGWVQIQLPTIRSIDRIEWARDRQGRYSDRLPVEYRIEVSLDGDVWKEIAGSGDRLPTGVKADAVSKYDFAMHSIEQSKRGKRMLSELLIARQKLQELERPVRVYAGTYSKPPATFRLYRGDPLQKREQVAPDTIASLGRLNLALDEIEGKRRTEFARWLTQNQNPLVARVMVNRLWQHLFGRGIVPTPNDFGNSGHQPSHPFMLDWLANELIQSGWSLKHVHRMILNSQAFQQSSQAHSSGMSRDVACSLLWRFPPRRLDAESIRDSILTVSGALDQQMGGPGFDGFEVQLENVRHFFPKKDFGPSDWRRMIYMTKVRQERDAVFGAFDCPDNSQIIARRSRSTTPLQSLNLLNSRFVLQQAEMMGQRIKKESQAKNVSPVQIAYQLSFAREATDLEVKEGDLFISEHGLRAFCRALLNANEFLFIQ